MQFIAVSRTEPPQQLLTLFGRSILGGGHYIVTCIIANKDCQRVHCGLSTFQFHWIIQDAKSKIVDTPLALILGHGYDLVLNIFAQNGGR